MCQHSLWVYASDASPDPSSGQFGAMKTVHMKIKYSDPMAGSGSKTSSRSEHEHMLCASFWNFHYSCNNLPINKMNEASERLLSEAVAIILHMKPIHTRYPYYVSFLSFDSNSFKFDCCIALFFIQKRGIKLNPVSTLYHIAPCCFVFLFLPFTYIELPKIMVDPAVNINIPLLLASATVAFGESLPLESQVFFTTFLYTLSRCEVLGLWSFLTASGCVLFPTLMLLGCLIRHTFPPPPALNMAVFLLIGKTSALTMNIAGVVKDWLLIGLSVLLFKWVRSCFRGHLVRVYMWSAGLLMGIKREGERWCSYLYQTRPNSHS